MNEQTNAVQKSTKKDIRTLLQSDGVKEQIALVLPKHLTPDRMARVALTAAMRNPLLLECTPESLLSCLMQCSQFGLEPDGRMAHLIPFKNRQANTVVCTLIIDWKGLAALALRSGMIAKLHADLICDKDEFAFDMGDILHHRINFRATRGEPYAAYAMAVTKTGEKFVQVMTKEEIEKIRDNSQGWRAFKSGYAKTSPWQDAPGEMWKKTAFRRLAKWLPLSSEFRDALEVDDKSDAVVDTSPKVVKPLFSVAEPEAIADAPMPAAEEDDVPMGDTAPESTPEPAAEKPAPTSPKGVKPNPLKAIRGLLKLTSIEEGTLIEWLVFTGKINDSLTTMEEIGLAAPAVLQWTYDNWAEASKSIKAATAK